MSSIHLLPHLGIEIQRPYLARETSSLDVFPTKAKDGGGVGYGRDSKSGTLFHQPNSPLLEALNSLLGEVEHPPWSPLSSSSDVRVRRPCWLPGMGEMRRPRWL